MREEKSSPPLSANTSYTVKRDTAETRVFLHIPLHISLEQIALRRIRAHVNVLLTSVSQAGMTPWKPNERERCYDWYTIVSMNDVY